MASNGCRRKCGNCGCQQQRRQQQQQQQQQQHMSSPTPHSGSASLTPTNNNNNNNSAATSSLLWQTATPHCRHTKRRTATPATLLSALSTATTTAAAKMMMMMPPPPPPPLPPLATMMSTSMAGLTSPPLAATAAAAAFSPSASCTPSTSTTSPPPPPPLAVVGRRRTALRPLTLTTIAYRLLTISLLIGILCPAPHSLVHCVDPKFDPTTRMRLVLVPADAQVGSVIYRLRATDEEFDYPLTFEFVGDAAASTVKIESLPCTKYNSVCQANVVLQRRLEPGRYYDFQVSVKDTKGGTATQMCSITATNFTTPHDLIFPHKPGIVMIPEDAKRGTELDYLIARKNPLFQKPVYLELWGSSLFAMRQKIVSPETTEGTVFLLGPLDFEKQAMYHLTVLANDAYAEPEQDSRNIAGLEIVVIVQDVQDQPPVFTLAPPVTKLPPGILPGDKILQVHAEDGDKGNPREVRYGLVSEGNPFTSFFDINDTSGEIFLMQPLEDIAAITHVGDPVLLTVVAEEVKVGRDEPPAMASTVQLAFFLPERTNSPPYFENDHYVTRVDENAPQGTALTFADPYVARVYDDDTGKNGVFSLTLLNNNGTFEITPNVAERNAIFVIRVRDNVLLDFEERQSVLFQILAQELGPSTNLSSVVNVTVYLNDVNDNAPVFEETLYTVELPENMTVGTKVVQVHATDADTDLGGKVRYTAILGYLNTSLNLNEETGLITVSTNNHGFDREVMPEYFLYVEARDMDGAGNRARVPLVIKLIDVNDETPEFERDLYEFILAPDLLGFTTRAFIRATDKDATAPNNKVRYEIINGNYDNKFALNNVTGELTVREKLNLRRKKHVTEEAANSPKLHQRRRRQSGGGGVASPPDSDMFMLTARAYDLGVPVRFSTTTIRIYPPESRTRTVTFVVPGHNPDKAKTEETLSAITGGKVIIHEIRPLRPDEPGAKNLHGGGGAGGAAKDRSVVTATVLYDSSSVVDISQIQQRLSQHNSSFTIMSGEEATETETLYKAENKLLFWLLILLATLVALTILILLLCCICSWCPLYGATSKRIVNISRTEDDVHLVHREMANGKQTKSVQVAEWMGRREAWSAEKPPDARTKPTRWEFRDGRQQFGENLDDPYNDDNEPNEGNGNRNGHGLDDRHDEERERGGGGGGGEGARGAGGRIRSAAEEQQRRVKIKNTHTAKGDSFHNSRTNLINDRDVYIEDVIDERVAGGDLAEDTDDGTGHFQRRRRIHRRYVEQADGTMQPVGGAAIDDDSMRRHEIDRGSDLDYNTGRSSLRNKREYFIKDGNVEILQLMTRDKMRDGALTHDPDEENNIYVNVPLKSKNLSHPQLLMVDNSGKEILMRRFIEEQPDGKQIIREHYQIVPGATYIAAMPNEVQQQQANSTLKGDTFPLGKSGPNSIVYSQTEPEVKVIHTQPVHGGAPGGEHLLQTDGGGGGHTYQSIGGGLLQPAISNQSLTLELENSLKQQNELLRQILLEKEKLEASRYAHQQEVALETQSLPGQSMAIATQTDCDVGTQTEADAEFAQRTSVGAQSVTLRRKARSENDDSMSEDDYEYVRFSPPDSPDNVYWIRRRRQKKRLQFRSGAGIGGKPRKRTVMVDEVKRKIRTPIKEEDDDEFYEYRKRSPPKKPVRHRAAETKASILRRQKNEESMRTSPTKAPPASKRQSEPLDRDVLMEISDSLDETARSPEDRHRRRQVRVEEATYYDRSGDEEYYDDDGKAYSLDSDGDEIVIRSNTYTPSRQPGSSHSHSRYRVEPKEHQHRFEIRVGDGLNGRGRHEMANDANRQSKPGVFSRSSSEQREGRTGGGESKVRLSRRDSTRGSNSSLEKRRKPSASEPPQQGRVSVTKYQSSNGGGGGATRITTTTEYRDSKGQLIKERIYQSETDLVHNDGGDDDYDIDDGDEATARDVPKYMEWYYGKKKQAPSGGRTSTDSSKGAVGGPPKRKTAGAPIEKRVSKTRVNVRTEEAYGHETGDAGKYKPEPAPRKSPPKGARMLREDVAMNKQHKPKIETDANHPLVQHSEHRFERENAPDVPLAPTKLPHYMYPETPPYAGSGRGNEAAAPPPHKLKPKPSPIRENEVKVSKSKINLYIEDPNATHPPAAKSHISTANNQKQLNVSTLEDDHDSGIAMNTLLNSMGRRNPIAEKKSVFSIAYDDVSRVKKIPSGSESPQYS